MLMASFISADYFEKKQSDSNNKSLNEAMNKSLADVTREINQSLEIYALELKSLRSFVHNITPDELNYKRFYNYALESDYEKNYPGSRGFGFIRFVEQGTEFEYIDKASSDRGDDFRIKYLSQYNDHRFVIEFIEPEKNNKQAVGLDIGSETNRRHAALTAAHNNEVVLTAPITLVQANTKTKHGFLLLYPVFNALSTKQSTLNTSTPNTSSQYSSADNALYGWVYAPLLIDEILSAIQQHKSGLKLSISDVTAPEEIEFFEGPQENLQEGLHNTLQNNASTDIKLFGRIWRVKAYPSDVFLSELSLGSPRQVYYQTLVAFFLLTLFVSNVIYIMHRRIQALRQKTELAAVVENGIEGTIGLDENFCFKYWNEAAKNLLGFNEYVFGKPFIEWLEVSYSADYLIDVFKRVSKGEAVKELELNFPAIHLGENSGRGETHLYLNFQPIIQNGKFLGANVSMVDMTQLRMLQTQLEEKNQLLRMKVSRQHDELQTTTSLHESLLHGADFLIIATDLAGKITSANQKLEDWLFYNKDEVLGQKITDLFHTAALEIVRETISTQYKFQTNNYFDALVYQLKHQSRIEGEFVFLDKNGVELELQLTLTAIRTNENDVFGYLFIADDVRIQKALRFDLELVRSAIHNSEDILLWLDRSGSIKSCNPFAWLALGYSEFEMKHLRIDDLVAFSIDDSWQDMLTDLHELGTITDEKEYVTSRGQKIPCLVTLAKLDIHDQTFYFLAAKNIADRLSKERALEDALNLAAQANLAKDQFLANMGHELRTPLNEVHGCLQLMQLSDLSPKQISYLSKAKTSVRILTQAIGDVLDCGEIIRNKLELDPRKINLLDLLDSVGAASSSLAEDKNIEVYFDLASDLPCFIESDEHRLKQLLMCLMTNAIKFTDEGNVVLSARLGNTQTNDLELRFKISDTGIGISQEKQSEIFDFFAQAEMSANRSFGGLGLGLTISKRIIELMSGSIACESTQGKGTTFTFNIKVGKAKERGSDRSAPPRTQSLNVLIVDDNEISLNVLSRLISQQGWRVSSADNAERAIEILKDSIETKQCFDLALIDWNMPGKTGIELIKELRERFNHKELPVLIMVTAYTQKMLSDVDNQDIEALTGAFLTKPVTQSTLLSKINELLSVNVPNSALNSQALLLEGINILLVEDNSTNQFIAENLLLSLGADVSIASEGEEAWNILQQHPEAYDIVLMDIQMPGWDGYRASREIRSDKRFNNLPIVAMTANVLASDKRNCFEAGMNGHIGKPFELQDLINEILKHTKPQDLNQSHIFTDNTNLIEANKSPLENTDLFESHHLNVLSEKSHVKVQESLKRFGGSEELYVQSLGMFINELQTYIDALTLDGSDLIFENIKPIFHTLKGTSGLLGFSALSELALKCDQQALSLAAEGRIKEPLPALIKLMKKTRSLLETIFEKEASNEQSASVEPSMEWDSVLLKDLRANLQASNMNALDVFKRLKASLRSCSPDLTSRLETVLAGLQFKEALKLLEQIEQKRSEQGNA